jgi:hypothetical protein
MRILIDKPLIEIREFKEVRLNTFNFNNKAKKLNL